MIRPGPRLAAALALAAGCGAAAAHEAAPPVLMLDKAAQHRAGIRTVSPDAAPELLRLPARVVADPRRELRVAAPQDGVVEAEGGALPQPGQAVRAGQVLARLRPVLPQPERRDLDVELNTAGRDLKLGRMQIDRYGIDEHQRLEVKLPTPSIEILTGYRSAQARSGELLAALRQPLLLRAPRDGTVLRSPARAGQVAAAGQTLFELVADARDGGLAVALEYGDDDVDADGAMRAVTVDGRALPLRFVGAAYDAALRSHRALYALEPDAPAVVNQPLLVLAPHGPSALRLPAAAVFHHDGADWVWLHTAAQRFEAAPVRLVPGDGGTVRIAAGLSGGERVVSAGAEALGALARGQASP
ncbi:MAG TPA: HlyD family efflux transporter periplasmic adaptor subunit [Nevskia sp.]|nr:HlyD family efflux transporter periplasmic adaptor subunit [Nevskia sp.]